MRKVGVVSCLLLLVLAGGGLFFRQDISDHLRLRGYTPPAEVARLADNTTMQQSSRRLFYIQHPEVAASDVFNEHCRENEHTIVLGCYVPGQRRIFLLAVNDERLEGVKEVTAAHELLHAAYERLSSRERDRVNRLLDEAFTQVTDTRIRETVALYRKQNPAIVPNELHSILGTEVRRLPAELEEYYQRYFTDRSRIVGYSEQYESAFTERRNAVRTFDAQLSSLKDQIDKLSRELRQADEALRAEREEMNRLRANGQTEQYNAIVPGYNARVNRYNADIDRLDRLVSDYNELVQERNAMAAEEAELIEAIDSRSVVPDQQ